MQILTSFRLFACVYILSAPLFVLSKPVDVYSPPVVEPRSGDVWVVGETRRVVWDTSSPPKQITNPYGTIKLRKGDYTMDKVNLASRFNILDGSREVVVPNVTEGDDYRIVLFGDSGNWSDQFVIVQQPRHPQHHPYRP